MKKIYKEEDINLEVPIIFNLINNIEKYPNYLPWCTKTEVEHKSEDVINGKISSIKNLPNFPASSPLVVDGKPYLLLKNGDVVQIE